MNQPNPQTCLCPGDRQYRYRVNNRNVVTLICRKCGKPQAQDAVVEFRVEQVPA